MFSLKIFTIHNWEYILKMDLSNLDMDYMIPKGTSHTSVPNSTYEVPKGSMKPDLNPVSQGCQLEKIINFTLRFRTQYPCIRGKFFDIGPSKPVT